MNIPIFFVSFPDGDEIVLAAVPLEAAEAAGIQRFEYWIHRLSAWYAPIGEVPLEAIGVGGSLDGETISNLVAAWQAKGAPKIVGKAEPAPNLTDSPERPQ